MPSKISREAKRFEAATRQHLRESRAITMLGFDLEAASPGHAVLRMDARARHKQLNGVVHGGILAALADTAGAMAAYTTVAQGTALATVELKINYLEAVPESESRWRGECFVFDERVALGHGLRELRTKDAPR